MRWWAAWVGVGACWALACGKDEARPPEPSGARPPVEAPGTSEPAGTPDKGAEGGPSAPEVDTFQPTFHQPLEGSLSLGKRTTYRFRVPVARAGTRLRFVFRAGSAPLQVHQVTVARAETRGALASRPVALKIGRAHV